jgi:alpha-glucosidase
VHRILPLFLVLVTASAYGANAPVTSFELTSPNGQLRYGFTLAAGGVPTYEVHGKSGVLIQASKLGLVTNRNGGGTTDWIAGLKVTGNSRRGAHQTWKPVWGERAEIPDIYNELLVDLQHATGDRGTLQLQVRAYDEGIAFRYYFLESLRAQVLEFAGERTEFNLPAGAQAFWTPSAQRFYEKMPVKNWKSDCEVPLTIELPGQAWLCLAEAAQTNYPRMRLRAAGENQLVTQLYGDVIETSPWGTPWRVVLVADQPGRLLENNYLLLNLNPPNEIKDPKWIHPGKVMREVTLSTAGAKRLVDFAAEQNIDYVHFDAGWYGHEYEVASDASKVAVDPRRNPKGDLDLPEAIRYAKEKGRRVILYVNHRALERQIDVIFPLYRSWGVDGVKFGFVHTGSHRWVVWVHEAVKKAAQHQLVVDIHDNYRPTGFSRTYPNLLQQEGIAGDEEMPTATQSTIYPFTRFIAGAADHTYCFFDKRLKKTKAHQLALAAINFGPLQYLHWYDRPEAYANRDEIEFWKEMPTVWDDTRVVSGVPGEHVAVARRKGADWWLGAVTNVEARKLELPLTFLPPDTRFTADLFEDAGEKTVAKRSLPVTRETRLSFDLRASGGAAVHLRAAK